MTGNSTPKLLAALLALVLVAAACGSGDAAETSAGSDDTSSGLDSAVAAGDSDATADDAGGGYTVADAAEAAEEPAAAMEDSAAAERAAGQGGAETTTTMAASDQADAVEAPGGFFAPPEEPEEDLDAGQGNFEDYGVRPFVATGVDPLSTFALDVDTASYSVARQWLSAGSVPPPDSVRVEEYLNSFDYDYLAPSNGLNVQADGGPSPYDQDNVIVRVGVQAERVGNADRPDASLTFVIDTSGSMDRANRLGLVKSSLATLSRELSPADTVAIVTYSDEAKVILPPTSVDDIGIILGAIDSLRPTGSTNLEAGLRTGYDLANESFQPGGINRVVIASDGVANVGTTDPDRLASMIRDDADRGIQLVTVGVGMGSFNDVVMEQLADQGDGFYAYVNDEREADQLFSDELVSTLLTVAIDGKIQVEFNERVVDEYRLIGFENRAVLDDDFRNDDVDAGELGAGHQVTALYELKIRPDYADFDQIGTVQLRWEDPDEGSVRESRLVLTPSIIEDRWSDTDRDFKLAVTIAAFAELLRNSPHTGNVSLQQVGEEADALAGGQGPVQELADMIWQVERL